MKALIVAAALLDGLSRRAGEMGGFCHSRLPGGDQVDSEVEIADALTLAVLS